MLLDAHGIECSTGSACSAGVAAGRATCCWRWVTTRTAPGVAAVLARPYLDTAPTSTRSSRRSGRRSSRARAAGPRGPTTVKVLAAMSGGVDSAVAAARAVDAGHDVTGVHLALSPSPAVVPERRARLLLAGGLARRAAGRRRARHPVLRLGCGRAVPRDVVDDFVAEYAAGRTPNPCLRCNEKIKFAAVLDRALALGFDAVVHRPLRPDRTDRTGRSMHRAVDHGKDQSYVLGVLTPATSSRSDVPARRLAEVAGPCRGRAPRAGGGAQAGQPRHLLHRRRRHRGWLRGPARSGGRARSSTRPATVVGEHDGTYRLHRRPAHAGCASATRPRTAGPATSSASPVSRTVTVGPRESLSVDGIDAMHARWCERPPQQPVRCTVQLRAHGDAYPAVVRADGEAVTIELDAPAYGIAPGQSAVIYDGTRVVGSATISRTRSAVRS